MLIGFHGDASKKEIDPSEGEWLADFIGCSYYFEINTVSSEVFSSRSSMDSQDLETTMQDVFYTILAECVKGNDKARRRRFKRLQQEGEAEEVVNEPRLKAVKTAAVNFTAG